MSSEVSAYRRIASCPRPQPEERSRVAPDGALDLELEEGREDVNDRGAEPARQLVGGSLSVRHQGRVADCAALELDGLEEQPAGRRFEIERHRERTIGICPDGR